MLYKAIEDVCVLDVAMRTVTHSIRNKRYVVKILFEGLFPTRVMQQCCIIPKLPPFEELGRCAKLDAEGCYNGNMITRFVVNAKLWQVAYAIGFNPYQIASSYVVQGDVTTTPGWDKCATHSLLQMIIAAAEGPKSSLFESFDKFTKI